MCIYAVSKEAAATVVTVHVMSINLPEIADQPASQPAGQSTQYDNCATQCATMSEYTL